jgi:sensor histidine kinase YesM
MTSRVLNLGLMKAISDYKHISQVWRYLSLFHITHMFLLVLFTFMFFCYLPLNSMFWYSIFLKSENIGHILDALVHKCSAHFIFQCKKP